MLLIGTPAPAADRAELAAKYCSSCHTGEEPRGEFHIETASPEQWQKALKYVAQGVMPPSGALVTPTAPQRKRLQEAIEAELSSQSAGGTLLRRLNRTEYVNTLRDLFEIREIRLPPTFPEETNNLAFDTMSEGMFVTPGLLDAYLDVATDIADRMVALPHPQTIQTTSNRVSIGQDASRPKYWTRPDDETGLYFSGVNIAAWSGGFWDRAFIAPESGVYRVRIKASAEADQGADGKPLRLGFYALNFADYLLPKRALRSELPQVGELEITNQQTEWVETEIHLEKGEKFHVYCENRLIKPYPYALLRETGNTKDLRQLLRVYLEESQASPEPTIRFEEIETSGPIRPLPRQQKYSGDPSALIRLAERAFRRPLTESEKSELLSSVDQHAANAADPAYGVHYGIRRILTSPQFLYRETKPGKLDDFGLASRMSYFLWSTMPDAELFELASAGKLAANLDAQVARMVADPKAQQFIEHFTGQWLGNRKAASVMVCDVRHVWSELIRHGIVRATEMFFDEILQRNLSIRNFLDSDFTYANEPMRIAWGIPGSEVDLRRLEADQRQSLVWPEPERLDLTSLGPEVPAHVASRGGVLGLSGVLASTGDGVESSPILRGVWILENLFGTPPPPPPADVPALVADTSKAQTVREILSSHQSVESCAVCHRKIDPLGLAMENYDATGGWRDAYFHEDSDKAIPVESAAVMPDGTKLNGPADIKKLALSQPENFTASLTTKLLEYSTGRTHLSAGDKRAVRQIVGAEPPNGYGFRDLITAVVQSEAFQTK